MSKNTATLAPETVPEKSAESIVLTEVQIWPVRNPSASRVKAMASLVFNGALRVNGCRIVEGSRGLFLAFPGEKRPGTDQYVNLFFPVSREVNEKLQREVVSRFQAL